MVSSDINEQASFDRETCSPTALSHNHFSKGKETKKLFCRDQVLNRRGGGQHPKVPNFVLNTLYWTLKSRPFERKVTYRVLHVTNGGEGGGCH